MSWRRWLAVAALAAAALTACGITRPTTTGSGAADPAGGPASAAAAGGRRSPAAPSAPAAQIVRPVSKPAARPAVPPTPADVPMPDPRLTPGATQSTDTAAICTPGWASAHRDVSTQTKDAVAAEYGLSSRYGYEIDHLIPLELGGANTMANLWPEPYDSAYGATQKDGLEDWLHEQVCDGNLPLPTAQHEIATDWYLFWVHAGRPLPSSFGYSNTPGGGTTGAGSGGPNAPATPAPAPTSGTTAAAWCTASARPAGDGYPGDYDVYVHSDQPDRQATASDAGDTHSHPTDGSGYADVYLWHTDAGETVTVTVGAATCTTTAAG